jgi:FkbM family methyltransferase
MGEANQAFLPAFLDRALRALHERPSGNVDSLRHRPGVRRKALEGAKALARAAAARAGIVPLTRADLADAAGGIRRIVEKHQGLDQLFALLHDEGSRRLLIDLMAFRAVGRHHVKLPTNTPDYWRKVGSIPGLLEERRTFCVDVLGHLDLYQLGPIGFDLRLHAHPVGILLTFLLEQYRHGGARPPVEVSAGDVCIDAGGSWAETAAYFAVRAGEAGRVYSFEFIPNNLAVFRANLELNPSLRTITAVPLPLWSHSGEALRFVDRGCASRVAAEGDGASLQATTISLDDFVRREQVPRVDFIKMDIEGAELPALRGAEATLRAFRPKLAIALYHRLDDFIDIPAYLDGLGLGYAFFLGHFTIHSEETVLFARPAY